MCVLPLARSHSLGGLSLPERASPRVCSSGSIEIMISPFASVPVMCECVCVCVSLLSLYSQLLHWATVVLLSALTISESEFIIRFASFASFSFLLPTTTTTTTTTLCCFIFPTIREHSTFFIYFARDTFHLAMTLGGVSLSGQGNGKQWRRAHKGWAIDGDGKVTCACVAVVWWGRTELRS